jgi:hypothetical protein
MSDVVIGGRVLLQKICVMNLYKRQMHSKNILSFIRYGIIDRRTEN